MFFRISKLLGLMVLISLYSSCRFSIPKGEGTNSPDHAIWSRLLQKHVNKDGWVDYQGFINDSTTVKRYLEELKSSPPDIDSWTKNEQLAYWINVYNAFTVKLVMDHYPVESIKDIGSGIQIPFVNSPFDIKFIEINGQKLDLNNVEHGIIRRKFDDPRIHFAVNCASVSCPKLRNEAYTGKKLDQQLADQAEDFINDPAKNKIEPGHIKISKIFQWYGGDFTEEGALVDYINKFSEVEINQDAEIDYMDYDWRLNSVSIPHQ